MNYRLYPIILLLCIVPCETGWAQDGEPPLYEGPVLEFTALETICSEQGTVKFKLRTPKALHYENEDRVYPEGGVVEFYEKDLTISATARANAVYYTAQTDSYEFRGDVEIKSLRDNTLLNTEALHWQPSKEEVYTDKFIRIETADKLLTGEGLNAKQDLSHYSIAYPQGVFNVKSIQHNVQH